MVEHSAGDPRQVVTSAATTSSTPAPGQPTSQLARATVVGPDLTFAGAYATTAFIPGLDARDWIVTRLGYEVYLTDHQHTAHWSDGFSHLPIMH